jgi:toxin ParE1/3/4
VSAPARYAVRLTAGAEQDLDSLIEFVARHDSPRKAQQLLDRLLETTDNLSTAPQRGAWPRELLELGIRDYRQTFFKPYRLIYQVADTPTPTVFIVLIADGRRDLRTLLEQRLLNPPDNLPSR